MNNNNEIYQVAQFNDDQQAELNAFLKSGITLAPGNAIVIRDGGLFKKRAITVIYTIQESTAQPVKISEKERKLNIFKGELEECQQTLFGAKIDLEISERRRKIAVEIGSQKWATRFVNEKNMAQDTIEQKEAEIKAYTGIIEQIEAGELDEQFAAGERA